MSSTAAYLIIDASLAVRGVLPLRHSQRVTDWLEEQFEAGKRVAVPGLWLLEVTSTIHRLMMQRQISREEAEAILEALLRLPVEVFQEDTDLCQKPLDGRVDWANLPFMIASIWLYPSG